MFGLNKTSIIIITIFLLLLAASFILLSKSFLSHPSIKVVDNPSSNNNLSINNKNSLNEFLSESGIINIKPQPVLNPNGSGSQDTQIKDIRIEMTNTPQSNVFYDEETNTKPVISFSHSINKGILYLSIYVDRTYYDQIGSDDERNRMFTAGVLNYLYLITHPTSHFNRQEVQQQLTKNAEALSRIDKPLFILN